MNKIVKSLPALAALAAGAVMAQSNPMTDPLDAAAAVPRVDYRSAVSDYRMYRDSAVADWRETNSEVRRLGGHAGHVEPAARGDAPSVSGQAPGAGADHRRHHGSPR